MPRGQRDNEIAVSRGGGVGQYDEPVTVPKPLSISAALRKGIMRRAIPKATAADSTARNCSPLMPPGNVSGLSTIAIRSIAGAISFSSSSHLPPIVGSKFVKPVELPPGRGKDSTNPLPTGSATTTKTFGTARVSCRSAMVAGVA
jgi:hypothetical protein